MDAFNSFGVQTKMKRGEQLSTQYKLDGVPAIVIDGHYVTSPVQAGRGQMPEAAAQDQTFVVADTLVAKALQERAGKK